MATRSSTSRGPNPLVAAVASALLPGLGQWLVGDRKKARTLFIIDGLTLLALLFFFHDKVSIVTAFVRPSSLALMMIVNIVILGYRVWAADDAYRSATEMGRSVTRIAGIAVMLALGFFLLMPHVVFGYYDLVQYSLITTVFDGGEASGSTTTTVVSAASGGAGDGTTTATVLADAMIREGLKNVAAGANPIGIQTGIDTAVKIFEGQCFKWKDRRRKI